MDAIESLYTVYDSELQLYHELKLKVPNKLEHGVETYLGQVNSEYGHVKIWVTALPARFYRFEIHSSEGNKNYRCSTGSGSLTEYWPIAKQIMYGMFVIDG